MSTWRSTVSTGGVRNKDKDEEDDWETDPDFIVSFNLIHFFVQLTT